MSNLPTSITKMLPYMTAAQQKAYQAYYAAREWEYRATVSYRLALKERGNASRSVWEKVDAFTKLSGSGRIEHLTAGQIIFNLRNRAYYEVCVIKDKPRFGNGLSFQRLSSTTARRGRSSAYGYIYGPRIILPASHPFHQKREKARLAERLEGKE